MKTSLVLKRIGFYILSLTWGVITSFIGLIVIAICACFKKVHVYHGRLYAVIGEGWGGVSLGCFFVCGLDCQRDVIMSHECGHGLQNIIFGPFAIFLVYIPSVIRYWYREYFWRNNREKYHTFPPYDAIWFEGQATRWGYQYIIPDKI